LNRRYAFLGLIFLVIITVIATAMSCGYLNILPELRLSGFTKEDWEFFTKFLAYKEVLNESYYEEIDNQKIYDGALHGMAEAVGDKYTEYLGKDENQTLTEEIESHYEGLGIYVSVDLYDNNITIVGLVPESPAEKYDLKVLDKIIKVNGQSYNGDELEKAVDQMKGPAGDTVELTILRDGEEITKKVVREEVSIKSVNYENKSGVGYIEILKFDNNTAELFDEAYNNLIKENISGLIIDLRDNGGGVYDEVIEIAQKIIPKGLIVYTEDKEKKQEKVFSESDGINIDLVVLINGNSASASEILAGAVKDRDCGTLIGEKTYGKGLVQGVYEMSDGTAMKVTIARYYTPSGVCIDGVGIEPDILIKDEVKTTKDEQLEKALEILMK